MQLSKERLDGAYALGEEPCENVKNAPVVDTESSKDASPRGCEEEVIQVPKSKANKGREKDYSGDVVVPVSGLPLKLSVPTKEKICTTTLL